MDDEPANAPIDTFLSVITPSKGAVIRRYCCNCDVCEVLALEASKEALALSTLLLALSNSIAATAPDVVEASFKRSYA
ncbi:hypothetical protein D3C86_1782350 [compost metagenome]